MNVTSKSSPPRSQPPDNHRPPRLPHSLIEPEGPGRVQGQRQPRPPRPSWQPLRGAGGLRARGAGGGAERHVPAPAGPAAPPASGGRDGRGRGEGTRDAGRRRRRGREEGREGTSRLVEGGSSKSRPRGWEPCPNVS